MHLFGLGNPGEKYFFTRHNSGSRFIDFFLLRLGKEKFSIHRNHHSIYYKTKINNESLTLVKPLTFMNLSGKSILAFKTKYKFSNENMLVIYDDVYLNFGTIKFRGEGGSGGHNGIQSIIDNIGKKFNRLKMGIGYEKLNHKLSLAKFVLEKFTREEEAKMNAYLEFITKIVMNYLQFGLTHSMQKYNNVNFES